MKPNLSKVTLICADTTPKVEWSLRAVEKTLEQCDFAAVKLLTNRTDLKYAVKIPEIKGLDGYSKFCIKDMARYVETPFALIVQYDGYCLNGAAWTEEFEGWDYIGAPTDPSGKMQNGGYSWRSKRLLDFMAQSNWADVHPEDFQICLGHRAEIESSGMKFAPVEVARKFSMEGRSFNSVEWSSTKKEWAGEFGWHSLLTKLPPDKKPCNVAVSSGDAGDLIYGLAAFRAMGGGMMFVTPHNNYPYPKNSKWALAGGDSSFVDNIAPLVEAQPYIVGCRYTHGQVHSCDYDLNKFRLPWKSRSSDDFKSIFRLHADAFNLNISEDAPWLTVPDPISIPNRPIVVNLTARYRNDNTRWDLLVKKYHGQMAFVGNDQEAELFQGIGYPLKVPHYKTKNLLEVAQVIAGGKIFIGNQSAPLAIAHGLGQRVVCECWPANSNCELNRPGKAFYWKSGEIEIPKEWL